MITGLEKLYWMRKLISVVSFFCISVLLLTTFRLFKGGYLVGRFQQSLLGSRESLAHMASYVLNPLSSYFRPTGMMCYWLLLRFCDLNPGAYHGFSWSISPPISGIASDTASMLVDQADS